MSIDFEIRKAFETPVSHWIILQRTFKLSQDFVFRSHFCRIRSISPLALLVNFMDLAIIFFMVVCVVSGCALFSRIWVTIPTSSSSTLWLNPTDVSMYFISSLSAMLRPSAINIKTVKIIDYMYNHIMMNNYNIVWSSTDMEGYFLNCRRGENSFKGAGPFLNYRILKPKWHIDTNILNWKFSFY